MGYIATGILFFSLYLGFMAVLKVTKKEKGFMDWVNK